MPQKCTVNPRTSELYPGFLRNCYLNPRSLHVNAPTHRACGLPGHIDLLFPNIDLHCGYAEAPKLGKRPDGRQVAGLYLANPLLVKLLLPDGQLRRALGIEAFRVVRLSPPGG